MRKFRPMVAGDAGLIGSNLIERLSEQGSSIKATLHHKRPVVRSHPVEYVSANLTDLEECEEVIRGIDYEFN